MILSRVGVSSTRGPVYGYHRPSNIEPTMNHITVMNNTATMNHKTFPNKQNLVKHHDIEEVVDKMSPINQIWEPNGHPDWPTEAPIGCLH